MLTFFRTQGVLALLLSGLLVSGEKCPESEVLIVTAVATDTVWQ